MATSFHNFCKTPNPNPDGVLRAFRDNIQEMAEDDPIVIDIQCRQFGGPDLHLKLRGQPSHLYIITGPRWIIENLFDGSTVERPQRVRDLIGYYKGLIGRDIEDFKDLLCYILDRIDRADNYKKTLKTVGDIEPKQDCSTEGGVRGYSLEVKVFRPELLRDEAAVRGPIKAHRLLHHVLARLQSVLVNNHIFVFSLKQLPQADLYDDLLYDYETYKFSGRNILESI